MTEMRRQISRLTVWIRQMTRQEREHPSINPIQSNQSQSLTLLEYLNKIIQESNVLRSNYWKTGDLKVYAKAVSFLQERGIETLAQFQEVVTEIKRNYRDTNGRIKRTEKMIHERKELVDQSEKYLKYRPVYVKYRQTKPRKQDDYYNQHTAELILYQTAERYLKEHLGDNRELNLKGWKKEIVTLNSEKKQLYDKVYEMKAEVQEAETIQKCVEQAIQAESTKEQTKRRDMEL